MTTMKRMRKKMMPTVVLRTILEEVVDAISLKNFRIRDIQGSGVSTPCVSSLEDSTGLQLPSLNGDWDSFGLFASTYD